jgi:hypothetical protein
MRGAIFNAPGDITVAEMLDPTTPTALVTDPPRGAAP